MVRERFVYREGPRCDFGSMIDDTTLDAAPLFRGLNAQAREELRRRSTIRRFAPGEVLWRKGSEPRGLFVVLEGEVRVVRSSRSRQHVVHTEGPGGTLGEVPLFAGGRYPATAIASQRTACLAIGRDGLLAAVHEDPELAWVLLGGLAQRVRELVDRVDSLAVQSVKVRLAGHLLDRRQRSAAASFTLGRSQAEVAEEIGTVREVLARALRQLRDEGVLRSVGHGRFEILDEPRLRAIAEG